LETEDGQGLLQHNDKEDFIWASFKQRLGFAEFTSMQSELLQLLNAHDGLDSLETPFTKDEIDSIVAELPSDKSPGPDGFNIDFFKRCWPVIKEDFYALLSSFL
jgi:hypothetical protein